jgi:hypothetical protein
VPDEQAHAADAAALAEPGEIGGQGVDALDDELDAPVGARQLVEDRAVVDEGAPHLARRPEGVVEGGVIGDAQVAAEPDERGVEGLLHRPQCAERPHRRRKTRASFGAE